MVDAAPMRADMRAGLRLAVRNASARRRMSMGKPGLPVFPQGIGDGTAHAGRCCRRLSDGPDSRKPDDTDAVTKG